MLPGSNSDIQGKFIPEECFRYGFKGNINETLPSENSTCPREWFNTDIKNRCNEWIFDEHETTIVNEVW